MKIYDPTNIEAEQSHRAPEHSSGSLPDFESDTEDTNHFYETTTDHFPEVPYLRAISNKIEMRLFRIHEPISVTAAIAPPLVLWLWPIGTLGKMLMQGFSQVWWTEAKSGGFSRLPLLWATNIDTEGEIEEKKGEEFPLPPLP